MIWIETATPDTHAELVKIAKTSPYTSAFSNRLMFSSDAAYAKGWIRLARHDKGHILGFTCVRHKSRGEKKTMLYFIVVDPAARSTGVGKLLVKDLMKCSPSGIVELNVAKDNERARKFYEREGFGVVGEGMKGEAWRMEKRA